MAEVLFNEQMMGAWAIAGILAIGLVGVKLLFIHKNRKREGKKK